MRTTSLDKVLKKWLIYIKIKINIMSCFNFLRINIENSNKLFLIDCNNNNKKK